MTKAILDERSFRTGFIINNGHYDILLLTDAEQDEDGRWRAKGRRWIKTRKVWEDAPTSYGWTVGYTPQQGSQK